MSVFLRVFGVQKAYVYVFFVSEILVCFLDAVSTLKRGAGKREEKFNRASRGPGER